MLLDCHCSDDTINTLSLSAPFFIALLSQYIYVENFYKFEFGRKNTHTHRSSSLLDLLNSVSGCTNVNFDKVISISEGTPRALKGFSFYFGYRYIGYQN